MRTFTVSDVSPAERPLSPLSREIAWASRLDGARIEACGSNLDALVTCADGHAVRLAHPFLLAVHEAFAQHYPLVLSPDDVWLCIAQGFGMHVNVYAEELRGRFVKHEGKVKIVVRRDGFVRGSPENDWPGCFAEFSDRIAEHVGKVRDLVVADFSTTGPVERAASEVVLMSAMRAYFSFELLTMCGIPEITLLGTAEDWRNVRRRAEFLSEFELATWTQALLPVLDHFVAAAEGKALDRDFWTSFYKLDGGSGGPYVTGWINVLFPYLGPLNLPTGKRAEPEPNRFVSSWRKPTNAYHWGPNAGEFPKGLSMAPFIWDYLGTRIPMELVAGFVGVSQDPTSLAVRPSIGWAVRDASPTSA
ncbi:DUF4419 domain-containing protein [Polyangium sp. 6x1]|uniref:DUF4419 domain-containing protein n=1 Tax=Polyangium sp. 6x1 TaxID=3042689 RepID=UPI00248218D7|nr:DUF4419 domain-containing protein [Polyangium sp. 6x1]MDI1449994.1 DUF4419 domain-containing protein [Polyangium sp. 6x1]